MPSKSLPWVRECISKLRFQNLQITFIDARMDGDSSTLFEKKMAESRLRKLRKSEDASTNNIVIINQKTQAEGKINKSKKKMGKLKRGWQIESGQEKGLAKEL